MRFCLIHLDSSPRAGEEAAVLVPGGERVAMMVPLDVLPDFLPLLHEATEALGTPLCDGCGEPLPGPRPEV